MVNGGLDDKESACNAQDPGSGEEEPLEKEWLPTPVFLPGEFHVQRSLVGYSPQGHKESDMTEQLTLHSLQDMSKSVITMFSSRIFPVSSPTFRYLIHCEFILMYLFLCQYHTVLGTKAL